MMRVIYRFSVRADCADEFAQIWSEATSHIQRLSEGARGSVLLRRHESPHQFVAVARWESRALWAAFYDSDRRVVPETLRQRMKELLSADTVYEVLDELIDFPATFGD